MQGYGQGVDCREAMQRIRPPRDPMPVCLRLSPAVEAATDDHRGRLPPRSTKSKRPSSARKNVNWNRRAWRVRATCRYSKSYVREKKSDVTIHAPAAAARNIRNAAERPRNITETPCNRSYRAL